ncbi:MAG: succinate dehydrogenase, cytochrome b556 subunit [Woeseia sp.]|nr:succinate dehydrogenase, cytochrome b556 subunit [Woeseia sp.]
MSKEGGPLSPHLTIYRWPITMILSILHRATGLALSFGLLVFAIWLGAAVLDSAAHDKVKVVLGSTIGQLFIFGCCLSFFFHLSNGIRHLIWDAGYMFEKRQANVSSWFVLVMTVFLTFSYWFLVKAG